MDDGGTYGPDDLPDDLRELVKPELVPGERLIWASRALDRTPRGRVGPLAAALIWAAGLFAASGACLAILFSPESKFRNVEGLLVVVGLLSGIIGFFVVIGVIAAAVSEGSGRRRLARRMYALTDRRAIIWAPRPGSDAIAIHTFTAGTLKGEDVRRLQYPDGTGDVFFRAEHLESPGFQGVADVRIVEMLVRRFLVAPAPPAAAEVVS